MFKLKACSEDYAARSQLFFEHRAVFPALTIDVFNVVAGLVPGAEKLWFPNFRDARWLTPLPHGVASIREYRLTYMRLLEHFAVWQPGRRLAFWVSECSLPLLDRFMEDYEFTPTSNGSTEMRWRIAYEPNRWLKPLHGLLRGAFAGDFEKATSNLVRYFDAEP